MNGRIAHLGPGVPCRAGIDFSPADTPIEAYTQLRKANGKTGHIINNREEIMHVFEEVKKWSRGFGDMLMINKNKAIPAEFFYLRPQDDNMVLRIVRISELRLPFQPESPGMASRPTSPRGRGTREARRGSASSRRAFRPKR